MTTTSECAGCNGARYVTRRVPVGHPDFGQVFPCRQCREPWHPSSVGLGRGPVPTFATFDDARASAKMRAARDACLALVNGERWCVLIEAGTGKGKTHLGKATVAAWMDAGLGRAFFADLPSELEELTYLSGHSDGEETVRDRLQFLRSRRLLVLDDLGADDRQTPFRASMVLAIVKAREEDRSATIVTTNVREKDWRLATGQFRIDPQVTRRLEEGRIAVPRGA